MARAFTMTPIRVKPVCHDTQTKLVVGRDGGFVRRKSGGVPRGLLVCRDLASPRIVCRDELVTPRLIVYGRVAPRVHERVGP